MVKQKAITILALEKFNYFIDKMEFKYFKFDSVTNN